MAGLRQYLKEHHNGVIQSVCAVYCAGLATWERLHPITTVAQPSAPPVPNNGAVVSSGYVMPWYLWAGIMALSLSVGIPAVIKLIRRENDLKTRVASLAKEMFEFLRSLPPKLQTAPARTSDEVLVNARKADNGRVEKVHHGYMHRFRNRVVALGHELAENGIQMNAQHYEIDPPQIQREDAFRNVAQDLKRIALELEIGREKA